MSEAQKARTRGPLSEAQKAAIQRMLDAKPKGPPSDEARRRMSAAKKGKTVGPMSDEAKAKKSAAMKALWAAKKAAGQQTSSN